MGDIFKLLKEVEAYYKKEGRSYLPWRPPSLKIRQGKADPYAILVAEVMLQQTQVDRVIPFYKNFLKQFPTPTALAKAPLSKVLLEWQGLGYNRRARFLQEAAKVLAKEGYTGQKLPGVGPYTEGAIDAFALNKPSVIIETNIRTVFFYFCFKKRFHKSLFQRDEREPYSSIKNYESVSDAEILPLVAKALEKTKLQPRDFYAALMDYGSKLKKEGVKLNKQSKHYGKQSKFEGSARQLRGAILRELLQKPATVKQLTKNLSRQLLKTEEEVEVVLVHLVKENLVTKTQTLYRVAE